MCNYELMDGASSSIALIIFLKFLQLLLFGFALVYVSIFLSLGNLINYLIFFKFKNNTAFNKNKDY